MDKLYFDSNDNKSPIRNKLPLEQIVKSRREDFQEQWYISYLINTNMFQSTFGSQADGLTWGSTSMKHVHGSPVLLFSLFCLFVFCFFAFFTVKFTFP